MKTFTESLRYDYPLTPHSVVLDVGAHECNWSLGMWRRYGCHTIALEPIREFYWNCVNRCRDTPIQVLPFGLGTTNRRESFGVHGSMSGAFCTHQRESVEIISVAELFSSLKLERVDVIKINCEGGEYEILEGIVSRGMAGRIANIQCQFHDLAPDHAERCRKIHEALSATHELEWDVPWVWTGWKLK